MAKKKIRQLWEKKELNSEMKGIRKRKKEARKKERFRKRKMRRGRVELKKRMSCIVSHLGEDGVLGEIPRLGCSLQSSARNEKVCLKEEKNMKKLA